MSETNRLQAQWPCPKLFILPAPLKGGGNEGQDIAQETVYYRNH